MLYYIYDGSFDGLLTSIYEAYYEKEEPDQIVNINTYNENFLIQKRYIKTDHEKSQKVHDAIIQKISRNALTNVLNAYLSEHENAGIYVLEYLRFGFKTGKSIDSYLSDDRVHNINQLSLKIVRERHLLLGILRFRLLENNIFYAPVEPQCNVIGLLGEHFSERMADQNFVIHDVKRNYGVFYNKKEWFISDISIDSDIILHEKEIFYQELWKQYFDSITIKERINPKLQAGYMPKRYWKYLIEMN